MKQEHKTILRVRKETILRVRKARKLITDTYVPKSLLHDKSSVEDGIVDAIADLLHLAHHKGFDVEAIQRRSYGHLIYEISYPEEIV
jgi:hypothetical protein